VARHVIQPLGQHRAARAILALAHQPVQRVVFEMQPTIGAIPLAGQVAGVVVALLLAPHVRIADADLAAQKILAHRRPKWITAAAEVSRTALVRFRDASIPQHL
jgi:hypothetical protein